MSGVSNMFAYMQYTSIHIGVLTKTLIPSMCTMFYIIVQIKGS